jgi:hypothetical protein
MTSTVTAADPGAPPEARLLVVDDEPQIVELSSTIRSGWSRWT